MIGPAKHPKVSVVMPAYNGLPFVEEAIRSVIHQTYKNWELVVVDDGSTDGTLSLMYKIAEQDSRLVVMTQKNKGGAAARNTGIGKARGEYIALLDADDVALEDRLALQVAYLDRHRDDCVIGGAYRHIAADGSVLIPYAANPAREPEELAEWQMARLNNGLYDPTIMFRRADVLEVGAYREQFRSAYDYDLWLRLQPCRMANLPHVLTLYRRHAAQTTSTKAEVTLFSSIMAYTSYACAQAGRADPAEGWQGGVDLRRLIAADPDPIALARLYAGMLLINANGTSGDGVSLSPQELVDALTSISLRGSRLTGADAAPLLEAVGVMRHMGRHREALRFLSEVARHCPNQLARAVSRPWRRRVGLTRELQCGPRTGTPRGLGW